MKKSYKVFLGIIITIILAIAVLLVRVIYLNSVNQFDSNYEVLLENTKFLNTPIDISEISFDKYTIPTIGIITDNSIDVLFRLIMYRSIIMDSPYCRYYYKFSRKKPYSRNDLRPYQTINLVVKIPNARGSYHCLLISNDEVALNHYSVFIAWDNTIPQKSDNDIWDYRSNYCSITETTRIIYSNLDKAELQKLFPEFDGIVKKHYPKKITINYEKMPKSSEDNIDEHIQFEW